MNRATAMEQLGETLGVSAIPDTITGLVASLGGTRAAAIALGAPEKIPTRPADGGKTFSAEERAERNKLLSPQRTLQRYMRAEQGETGKNVRGKTEAAHSKLTGDLKSAVAEHQKANAEAKFPRGFHASVKGNFVKSEFQQRGRAVKPVYIPREDMEAIIDNIQAGDYKAAASAFDDAYGNSYDVPGMQWGDDVEHDSDPDAFESLEIH